MPSLQSRIGFQKRVQAYSTLSANLLTELDDLNLLRELVRQAEVAAKVRRSVQTQKARQPEPAARNGKQPGPLILAPVIVSPLTGAFE
jgi:hypothetical protein